MKEDVPMLRTTIFSNTSDKVCSKEVIYTDIQKLTRSSPKEKK